ncbi:hypothetical protein [Streptomyces sp. SID2888]|uniref:hypothetical protein n=1 Tax=Streptomyces sp. SID2888 TaxID=2690256 RepID=UPI001371B198|nr:hypothetical protein [Streptomyces sp. SID2888]MYV44465.1 hypothetical protein [Streptomyces sp. SID2888]
MIVLLLLNAVSAMAGIGFAILAVLRPAALTGEGTESDGGPFYARMYAAKAVPFGVVVAVVPFLATGAIPGLCLLGASVSQMADATIGFRRGDLRQTVGSAVAATVHAVVATLVWRA